MVQIRGLIEGACKAPSTGRGSPLPRIGPLQDMAVNLVFYGV